MSAQQPRTVHHLRLSSHRAARSNAANEATQFEFPRPAAGSPWPRPADKHQPSSKTEMTTQKRAHYKSRRVMGDRHQPLGRYVPLVGVACAHPSQRLLLRACCALPSPPSSPPCMLARSLIRIEAHAQGASWRHTNINYKGVLAVPLAG